MGQQKNYQRIYLSSFTLIALLIIIAVLIIDDIVVEEAILVEMNVVGSRQTTLSERIVHLLLEYAIEDNAGDREHIADMIAHALVEFDTTHELLIRGQVSDSHRVSYSDSVDAVFFDPPQYLDEKARIFVYNAHEVMSREWSPELISNYYLKQLREASKQDLHQGLAVLARQYTEDNKGQIMRLRLVVAVMLGGILTVLLALAVLVFNPLFRRIESQEAELLRMAYIDVLTGCHNRRSFLEHAAEAFERSRRYGHSFAILYIDIDDFKDINDSHGHAFGDKALKQFTDICLQNIRDSDIFGRLGGDEFAILLQECDHDFALKSAEKMRRKVADYIVFGDNESARLNISIGVSTLAEGDNSYHATLKRADRNLYLAKQAGRNRVINAYQG